METKGVSKKKKKKPYICYKAHCKLYTMSNLFLGEVASAESESEQMVLCANCFLTLNRKDEFKKHLPSRCLPVADARGVCSLRALVSLWSIHSVCRDL